MVKRLQKSAITAAIVTLCLLLAAVLMFTFVPASKKVYAENEPSVWDGDLTAAGWGSTDANKPAAPEGYVIDAGEQTIKIGSAAALAYFSHEVYIDSTHALDGYTVELTTDIDLDNKTWIPIGTTKRSNAPDRRFLGTFDGKGHTISNFNADGYFDNIKYTAADGYYVDVNGDDSLKIPFENGSGEFAFGLFGVTANMTLKNLTLSNVQIDFSEVKTVNGVTLIPDNVGAFIGHNAGKLTVENCVAGLRNENGTSDSTIKIKTAGNPAVGGLVGRAYGVKLAGSSTTTTFETIRVKNSTNNVDIEYEAVADNSTLAQYGKVSGILGYGTSFKGLFFENCVNYGNIDGGQFVGGIMAFFTDSSKNNKYDDGDTRVDNAWVLKYDKCVNYGNLTSSNLDTAEGYGDGKTYVGGITAYFSPSTDNYSSIISTNANYNKLAPVHFHVTDCRNYGTISAYNTEAKNGSPAVEGRGWNAAAGIVGGLTASETGKNELTNNYNYGDVKSIAKAGSTYYTPRMGGYIGWLYYYWGAEASNHPNYVQPSVRPIDLTITGGSCGQVTGESTLAADGKSHIGSLIGDDLTYPTKPCNIALVDANDYTKNIERGNVLPEEAGDPSAITIGASVTEINDGQYVGYNNLTEVTFAENSTLAIIGAWAFAGTGVTQINLPASVAKIGEYAFGSDVLVIAKDKEHYDALVGNVTDDIKELLTYVVTVEYKYLDAVLDTEYKLYNKPYAWELDEDGTWEMKDGVELGTSTTGTAVWYVQNGKTPLTVGAVTNLLKTNAETLELYTYTSDTKVFFARENLVYNGTAYTMTELNPLLQAAGDRILPTMTASIVKYVDPDGVEADNDNLPTTVCNAGTYTVKVVEGEEEYEPFDIHISRATLDLANYSNLSWRVMSIGGFTAANIELLNGNGMTLYMYDKNGKEYPSTTILSDEQIEKLGLTSGEYTIKTVMYSVVRNRNSRIEVKIEPNEKYTQGPYADNTATEVGAYNASVVIKANSNYKFTKSTISAFRCMEVQVGEDGKTATVTKKWYIADMSNWLVSANGGEYAIPNHVYGETANAVAPALMYGTADKISMKLSLNGTQIGSSDFGVADFTQYVNRVMPAGSYELEVTVQGFESEEVDPNAPDDTSTVKVYRSGFTETISFTVYKASLPSLTGVNAALKGKTFTYTWDGSQRLYNADAEKVVNDYLDTPSLSTTGTVWADYNQYYAKFAITFNLASMQSDVYYTADDTTKVATADPGKYTVYYRISAPNYYSSTENLASGEVRQNYYFDVVNIREIDVPTIAKATYTGSSVYPTLVPAAADDEQYYDLLMSDEGYVTGGRHSVTLKLRNSEFYCWLGEEVGIDTVVVPFIIEQADNDFTTALNILGWHYETFDAAINSVRAAVRYLDDGETIHFRVVKKDETDALNGLADFTVDGNGRVNETVAAVLNALKVGDYTLYAKVNATNNYKEYERSIPFAVSKAMNSWADGDDDLKLPSWIVGKYDKKENAIVVNAAHGQVNIIVADINGKEYYNSTTGINKLNDCEVGKYLVKAWVDETTDFAALAERTFTIEVLEKVGLPWWATLLITLGALALAALIIFILWKKGVFQILTEKLVVAIRTKASVDATIASVRAAKKMEEGKQSVAEAKRRERIEQMREKAKAQRALPPEERAAQLEAKAQADAERAEQLRAKSESRLAKAAKMRNKDAKPATEEPTAETPEVETPETEAPTVEAPTTEAAAVETPETPTEE